jgi:hypothetical protein
MPLGSRIQDLLLEPVDAVALGGDGLVIQRLGILALVDTIPKTVGGVGGREAAIEASCPGLD